MMRDRLWILLAKKASGEIDAEELTELQDLLQRSEEAGFNGELMEELWQTPLLPAQADDAEAYNWEAVSAGIEAKEAHVESITAYRKWGLIAASVVLLVTTGLGGYWWALRSRVAQADTANTISTRPDTRSRITLPDGTAVWLNSDSRMTYNKAFGERKREITLEGEAFFDVARKADVPLVVHARGLDIHVLGTSFNVMAYPADSLVTASLIQGSVELSASSRPGWRVLLQPAHKISVPVNRLADSAVGKSQVHPDAPGVSTLLPEPHSQIVPEVSWVDNKLVFYREPFGTLADRMDRWYRVHIRIEDEPLKRVTLTGVFEKESLQQALTALQLGCRFHYAIMGDTVTITRLTSPN